MDIYCCVCQGDMKCELVSGVDVYPHRKDLASLPFWRCTSCKGYVGCHHKTKDRTKPLGCIPSPAIKNARQHIHKILDPLWSNLEGREKFKERARIYRYLSEALGYKYHTAEIRSIEEARKIYRLIKCYKLGDKNVRNEEASTSYS